jgi:outer membrane protein assembly factor BamA
MKLNINHTIFKTPIAKTIFLAIIAILFFSTVSAFAQSNASDQGDTAMKSPSADSLAKTPHTAFSKRGFAGAPYIKYAPETRWVAGLVGLYYFHLGSDTNDLLTRPSDVSAGVMYSQNKQYSIGIDYNLYSNRDVYLINGGFHYQQIPLDFYGIGDYSPPGRIDNYTPLRRGLEFYATRKLVRIPYGTGLNAGIEGEFRYDKVLSTENDSSLIATNRVPGANGGYSSGAGIIVLYDTRDNIYFTNNGQYESFDAEFYGRTLSSDYTFSRYTLDARKFISIAKDQVLAGQFYGVLANGVVPFYMMSELGGDSKLRGYYQGRFRENDLGLAQAEYRFPIWWRFGGDVFAGVGEVGHTLSDFSFRGVHPSFGAGLRLLVVPAEHLNARLDYGIGTDSKGLYLAILEAF